MLKYIAIIALLLASNNIVAQESSTLHVSGVVTDTLYRPIEYAVVQLLSIPDSTLSYGAVTAEDGTYHIKNIARGRYEVKVSSIGYEVKAKTVDLSRAKQNTSLGLTTLEISAFLLDDVEVRATRTGISERVDKIIFIPDSTSLRTARTGVDILNKLPEIRIDRKDHTVSVLGNKNVLILINGVDNGRSIVSIHPNDIERVELVTHPSVKYQSDVASVVNIVLKGYRQKGFTLSSNLYLSLNKKNHSGNIQLDYGVGKWRFFASYTGSYQRTTSVDSVSRTDTYDGGTDSYFSYPLSNNTADPAINRFQYGFDYNINENNLLSFTSRVVTFDLESSRHNVFSSFTNNQQTDQSIVTSAYDASKVNQNYSLYYLHKFEREKEKLEINANYFFVNDDSHHLIRDSTAVYPSLNSYRSTREINQQSKQHSLNLKIDYLKPITDNISLEFGYQLYGRKVGNETATSSDEHSDVPYKDYRNSVYANASYAQKKWSIQAGARVEHFNVKVSEVKNNQAEFLPYGAIFYGFNANNSLKLTYRKSLKYPTYSSLNPFRYYSSDSLSYFEGNPYLKPEQNSNLNLKYSYKKKSNYLSLSLNYDHLNDLITQKVSMDGSVLSYSHENVGKARRYEAVLSLSSVLFNYMEIELLVKGGYTDYLTKKSHSGYSYAVECGVVLPLFWDIDLEVYGVLKERDINYNGYSDYGGYIEEILLTKNVAKNLFVGLAVWQPFISPKDTDKTWGDSFTETNKYRELKATSYLVNLTYYFKSGKTLKKRKESTYMEEIQDKGKKAR